VGPPLPPPDTELPLVGRTLFIGVAGLLLALASLGAVATELGRRGHLLPRDPTEFISAATTAMWRAKYLLLPLSLAVFWACSVLRRRVQREPHRFLWRRFALVGHATAGLVFVANLAFTALFIPELIEQRRLAREAAVQSMLYGTHRMLLEYKARYGTYPASLDDLRRLPDPQGTNAKLLAQLEMANYVPSSVQAARMERQRPVRRARLRQVAVRADTDAAPVDGLETVSFTDYELLWPGPDGIYGTEDDRSIKNGVIVAEPRPLKSAGALATVNRNSRAK